MPENNEEEGRKSKNTKINGAKSSVPVSAKKATPKEEQEASSDQEMESLSSSDAENEGKYAKNKTLLRIT